MSHATKADFCQIFKSDMNRFYLLSLLLTADDAMAESCFVQGFEDAATDSRVFKDWAQSWARRTVIQNAIRTLQPRAGRPRKFWRAAPSVNNFCLTQAGLLIEGPAEAKPIAYPQIHLAAS